MEYVYTSSNVLSESLCDEIMNRFEEDPEKRTSDMKFKIALELNISMLPSWKETDTIVYNTIQTSFVEYLNHLGKTIPNFKFFEQLRDKGYTIEKFPKDFGYHLWHSDLGIYSETPPELRLVGFKMCLTDITLKDVYETRTYPKGSIFFYPATWTYLYEIPKATQDQYTIYGFMCTQ